jgi:hypothetical protein
MRGNPRPTVAMGLPGSGYGVSLTAPPRTAEAVGWVCTRVRAALVGGWKPGCAASSRMRVTGQKGVTDYDLGFTNFLYTFETSAIARADAAVRPRPPRTRRLG